MDESLYDGVVLCLARGLDKEAVNVREASVVWDPTEAVHSLGDSVSVLPGEGLLVAGVLVSDALGGVVIQGRLHVSYSGLESCSGEAGSSYSRVSEYSSLHVSDVLVE